MVESKNVEKNKKSPKKESLKKLRKMEIKDITTKNLISPKFKKIMKDKFGKISFPIFFVGIDDNNTLLLFEQITSEKTKEKSLTVHYEIRKISTEKLVGLKEALKEISDNNE